MEAMHCKNLSAKIELLDDRLIPPVGMLFEVVEKLSAATRHLEKPPA